MDAMRSPLLSMTVGWARRGRRVGFVVAAYFAVTVSGCASQTDPLGADLAGPSAGPSPIVWPRAGLAVPDDDPPGEFYVDDGVYDDDAGILDYRIYPPGLL